MHAPALVQLLQARGFEVRIAATEEALRFVRCEALEALIHRPVVRGMWPVDELHAVSHIELATWADIVVVAPASATTIHRIATGEFSSVVAAIALATRAPVLVVPAMNAAMYSSPSVQRNLAQLAEDGVHVAHPARGIEVADRPDERRPTLGGALPPDAVLQLIEAVLRGAGEGRGPRDAADWDRVYRTHEPAALPLLRLYCLSLLLERMGLVPVLTLRYELRFAALRSRIDWSMFAMNRSLYIIYAAIVLDAVGIGLIFPILPALLEDVTHNENVASRSSRSETSCASAPAV